MAAMIFSGERTTEFRDALFPLPAPAINYKSSSYVEVYLLMKNNCIL